MSLIKHEKELLHLYAKENWQRSKEKDFLRKQQTGDTYYLNVENSKPYLEEYEFNNPQELKKMLDTFGGDEPLPEELLTMVTVSCFKLRNTEKKTDNLPTQIYNF